MIRNVAPNHHNNNSATLNFFIMAKVDFAKGHGTILSGSVKYARLTTESGPDGMSEKYGCDLFLDDASIKQLTDLEIIDHVRAKNPQGEFKHDVPVVKIKSINVPKAYLANRQMFDGLIGDDSEIRANVWIKKWEHKGKKGLSIWLSAFVITKLVEYASNNSDALFEGIPDLGDPTPEQLNPIPTSKPNVASASEAFDGNGDDDLPF
jgi:hypothetical protein